MGKPGLVDVSQDHAGEGVVGQNVIDQLMKKEQEITDRLLKLGKVENTVDKDKQDQDGEEQANNCSQKEEMDRPEEIVLDGGPIIGCKEVKGAENSGIVDQLVKETKAGGKDVVKDDPLEAVTPFTKEDHSEETVVKDEAVLEDAGDILQPVVILDGQSISRVTQSRSRT